MHSSSQPMWANSWSEVRQVDVRKDATLHDLACWPHTHFCRLASVVHTCYVHAYWQIYECVRNWERNEAIELRLRLRLEEDGDGEPKGPREPEAMADHGFSRVRR